MEPHRALEWTLGECRNAALAAAADGRIVFLNPAARARWPSATPGSLMSSLFPDDARAEQGADAQAAKLSAKVDADLTAAQALTANVTTRKRVLFILSMQGGKILGAGTATAAAATRTIASSEVPVASLVP